MSDIWRVAPVALAALLWNGGLRAQVPPGATPRERAIIARADSEWVRIQDRLDRERQAERERSRGRLVEAGGLALVVPGTVAADEAIRSLDSAAVLLRDFGGIPDGFLGSIVAVFESATDTGAALASPVARGRQRVPVVGIQLTDAVGGAATRRLPSALVASVIARAYRDARDADWREWLPANYVAGRWTRPEAWTAFESLTRSPWEVGSHCLAGDARGCRLWLGVDREADPYRSRYQAREIRAYLADHVPWFARGSAAGRECLSGNSAACYDLVGGGHHLVLLPFPADEAARRSLVRAVRDLHGADALRRALADTAGGVGARFARAAGIGEDSLMLEWRYWVLTRGGRPQDRNLLADAAPAIVLAGLLLAVARRSRG